MRRLLAALAAFCAISALAAYPDKPVRLIIAYPPGGGTDIVGRYLQAKIAHRLGWQIVVDNRGGATGMIGTAEADKAAPDGYTLLLGHIAPNAINPGAFLTPPQYPEYRLEPVAMVAMAPSLLIVDPAKIPARTLPELRAWIAAQPKYTYASDGYGSLAHLQMQWLIGAKEAVHVPYKGGGPALQGVLSGDAPILFSPAPVSMAWVKSGKLLAIAQTTGRRAAALPDIPTMVEWGYKDFEAPLWWAIYAPHGTPRAVIDLWNREVNATLAEPEVRKWYEDQGYSPAPMTVEAFSAFHEAERRKWSALVEQAAKR